MKNLQLFYSIDNNKISQQRHSIHNTERIFRSYSNVINGEVVTQQQNTEGKYVAVIEISLRNLCLQ